LAHVLAGVAGTKHFTENVLHTLQELDKWRKTEQVITGNISQLEETLTNDKRQFDLCDRLDGMPREEQLTRPRTPLYDSNNTKEIIIAPVRVAATRPTQYAY
jgi:hypothetical protein